MSSTQTASTIDRFTASLDEIDVTWDRTDPEGVQRAVGAQLTEPAVGVPLGIGGASLPPAVETDPGPSAVSDAATGVTPASFGVADYGSVVLTSDAAGSEQMSLYPGTHVAVVRAADVVGSMDEAFAELGPTLREGRGDVIVATGASATSDMGALVRGVHGPQTVHVVIVDR